MRDALNSIEGDFLLYDGSSTHSLSLPTYRIPKQAFGGLREFTARKLRELAEEGATGEMADQNSLRPNVSTRYVREPGVQMCAPHYGKDIASGEVEIIKIKA